MKRWLLRITLCLILGAVTTVAVAWGCAALTRHFEETEPHPDVVAQIARFVGLHESNNAPDYEFSMESVGFSITYFGQLQRYEVRENRAGWPCPAMRGHKITSAEVDTVDGLWTLESGPPMVPVKPLLPGLLIDTLFYAAIWFGVFFGFTSAKRAIRQRRGRCPRCGYDLRGGVMSDKRLAMSGEAATSAAGCPECGWNRKDSAA